MSTTEIGIVAALGTLIVTRVADHFVMRAKSEDWVRREFAALVARFEKRLDEAEEHRRKCEQELHEIRDLLQVITPAE